MCTYITVSRPVNGSAKGAGGSWLNVRQVNVSFDHPVHAMAEHTLNIDLSDPDQGPSARVAIELTAESATQLVEAIQTTLASVPPALIARTSAGRPS